MAKKPKREPISEFLNLGLTKQLSQRLTAYCLRRMQQNGKMKHGLRTKIARRALEEWLDKHEKDYTLNL